MIWKRVTAYMVKTDGSVRREIRMSMKLITDSKRATKIYDKLGTDADCSCNDYHYSQQALIFLQQQQQKP
jgi:predicted aconitase